MGGGEDGGDGFLVVLEGAEVLFAKFAVIGGNADAVVGVGADFYLVDEVADGEGVVLGGTKNEGFLVLVNFCHEELDAVLFALFDFDDAVEVGFGVDSFLVDGSFDEFVFAAVDVFV